MSLRFSRIPYDWSSRQSLLEIPFPPEEYQRRVAAVRSSMARSGFDCLIIYGGPGRAADVRYLSNFNPSWGDTFVVLPLDREPSLVTGAVFHGEPMHSGIHETWVKHIIAVEHRHSAPDERNLGEIVSDMLTQGRYARVASVGLESAPFEVAAPLVERCVSTDVVSTVRAIKSVDEIALMEYAARNVSAGIREAIAALDEGVRDHELSAVIQKTCALGGAESVSVTLGFGARSSLKNMSPRGDNYRRGEIVLIDVVASYRGYNVDIARSVVLGSPEAHARKILEASLAANELAQRIIRHGTVIADLQAEVEALMKDFGVEQYYYANALGHGGGLSLAEAPFFYHGSTARLEAGMVFYLEPMVISHGVGSANIEDVVLVEESGCRCLSDIPHKTWE